MENIQKSPQEAVLQASSAQDIQHLQGFFHDSLINASSVHKRQRKKPFTLGALSIALLGCLCIARATFMQDAPSMSELAVIHDAAPLDPIAVADASPVSSAALSSVSSASSDAAMSSSDAPADAPDAHAGVYLTAVSIQRSDFLQSTIAAIKKAGGTSLVVEAKADRVWFNTSAPMANKLGLVDVKFNLQDLVSLAHKNGLSLIMRYVAVSDQGLTSALPDTQLKDPSTGKVITPGYIDPANPVALQYNSEIICDLARNGVDEINLDYIRFSTGNIYATSVYSAAEKSAHVMAFVQMARDSIDRCGPKTKLGISVFAIMGWDYKTNLETLGQDVVQFAPVVDVISPMAYPAMFKQDTYYDPATDRHSRMYSLVYRTMIGFQKLLGSNAYKLRPWIQGYGVTTKNVTDQIQAVMDSNLCGFQFWNAENDYGPVYKGMGSWALPERCSNQSPIS